MANIIIKKSNYKWTDKEMCKHFGHLEDHQYKHFNRALGVKVESKEHFKAMLDKGGYIPYDESCKQVDKNKDNQKYNGISEKAKKFLVQIKSQANKKGEIEWSDGLIDGMKKEVNLDYSYFKTLPKHFQSDLDTQKGEVK